MISKPVDIWRQSCIIPSTKKGDLRLATNYRGISLTPNAAKIYKETTITQDQTSTRKYTS